MSVKPADYVVAIHQPNYVPWAGYFYKMLCADAFIFLDDVQFSKNSFINRNRIKLSGKPQWLSIPVKVSLGQTIREVSLAEPDWAKKHALKLENAYRKAPYFQTYFEKFTSLLSEPYNNLADLNIAVLRQIAQWLGISCQFYLSSEIGSCSTGDERLVELLKKIGATTYLSGYGGLNYQSESKFHAENIALRYYDFKPLVYEQGLGEFLPGLSILDLLFYCGPESKEILADKRI